MNKTYYDKKYFSSCDRGSESLLSQEMQAFGVKKAILKKGGVEFKADPLSTIKAVLNSRIASRVYKYICSFRIRHEKEIYKKALDIAWDEILTKDNTFKIKNIVSDKVKHKFKNTLFINQILKDAIADNFNLKHKKRPNVSIKNSDFNILIHISEYKTSLYNVDILFDLSSYPLYKRAYKTEQTTASIKETLAASILDLINIKGHNTFIDTMCGSCTFPIEASLIKYNIPASYIRIKEYLEKGTTIWGFIKTPIFKDYKEEIDKYIKSIYKKTIDKKENITIKGYDIDNNAYQISRNNINKANLKDIINLEKQDATKLIYPKKSIIFANLPYGERLDENLDSLYYNYFNNLKNQNLDARIYVLTNKLNLINKLKIKTNKISSLYNGNIKCQLLECIF